LLINKKIICRGQVNHNVSININPITNQDFSKTITFGLMPDSIGLESSRRIVASLDFLKKTGEKLSTEL
jgi:hypothetical protein